MNKKIWLLAVVFVVSVAVRPCLAEKWFAPDVNRQLDSTSSNGAADANNDYVRGVYQQEVLGVLSPEAAARARFLKEKYNVLTKPVGGSMVTGFDTAHVKSYNATMRQLLETKFGRDVFKDADEFSVAYAKGAKDAQDDFSKGIRTLKTQSATAAEGEPDKAKEEHNNQLIGYNETMQKLLDDANGKKSGETSPLLP